MAEPLVATSVFDRLLKDRIIWLGSEVRDDNANEICAKLLLLAAEDSEQDIYLYINSPGGSITAGMAIYDTMQFVPNDIVTVGIGMAASMGQLLLTAGTKGKRYITPNARVLLHQPHGGFGGTSERHPDPGAAHPRHEEAPRRDHRRADRQDRRADQRRRRPRPLVQRRRKPSSTASSTTSASPRPTSPAAAEPTSDRPKRRETRRQNYGNPHLRRHAGNGAARCPAARYILPSFEERTAYGYKRQDPYAKLFEDRIIFLGVQVDDASADDVMAQLLVLESQDPDRDIVMYINSPGGSFTAMTAIYDTMQYIRRRSRRSCSARRPRPPPCCWRPERPASASRCRTPAS